MKDSSLRHLMFAFLFLIRSLSLDLFFSLFSHSRLVMPKWFNLTRFDKQFKNYVVLTVIHSAKE